MWSGPNNSEGIIFDFYSAKTCDNLNYLPVTLKVKFTMCCFAVFEIISRFVGIFMSGAGPGIQVVFLYKKTAFLLCAFIFE